MAFILETTRVMVLCVREMWHVCAGVREWDVVCVGVWVGVCKCVSAAYEEVRATEWNL